MANQNVIDYPAFGKETGITQLYEKNLREPEVEYGRDDLTAQIATLLNRPLWPLFPDGAYLNTKQARKLYRAAQGISGLIHVLNRSTYAGDMAMESLREPQQSKLWCALIELSEDVMRLADDMLHKSNGEEEY